MALPKLNNGPQYEMAIPSSGKSVRYRPFLVREQKALMLASESSDNKVMFRSVLDVLEQCVEDKIYQNQLTSFDVEYMFLQMRAKSVGESAEILIKCEECGADNPISINLEEIKVDVKDVDNKEVVEFIESMNSKQFEQIQKFISDIPRLSHTVKFDCKSCEHKNEITVEGISNFL